MQVKAADVVIVAAGSSQRFGGQDKLLADLDGHPVIEHTLRAALACNLVARIVIVTGAANQQTFSELATRLAGDEPGRIQVQPGGPRRRDSVEHGLRACTSDYVAIHDGARPLASSTLYRRCIEAAAGHPGAIAATPVTDTIKEVTDGHITGSPDRSHLWAAQTPQVVDRQAWLRAAALDARDETDDAAMLARLGLAVRVVEGERTNLKITHPEDLVLARTLLHHGASHP